MRDRVTTALKHPLAVGTIALVATWLVAMDASAYQQYIVSLVVMSAVIGAGLVLLVGVGGQLSLGHATFLAVGAYASAQISTRSDIGLPLELLVALVVAVVVGTLVGLPSLRLTGLLLAVGTLALGFAGQQLLYVWEPVTGGGRGMLVGPLQVFGREVSLLSASMVVMAVAFVLVFNILRGRTGRALHAIRTSDIAASSVGIEVQRRRVAAFAMSSALAAAGGVLYAHAVSYLSPDTFSVERSIQLVIMVIIGGQRRLLGAVFGAMFVIGVPEQFREVQKYEGILYGAILLGIIVFAPGGIVEVFDRLLGAVRRFLPSGRAEEAERKAVLQLADAAPEQLGELPTLAPDTGNGNGHHKPKIVVSAPGLPLSIEKVTVRFGGVTAVNDVSFDVAPGEVLGLIGPNGAGKTTLFNAVCGVVPSSGTVAFGDLDLSKSSVRRRAMAGIGRTFQNLSLHEGMTPIDHVLIGRHRFFRYGLVPEMLRLPNVIRSEREGRVEAEALLELVGLSAVKHVRGDDLPYGMQKRVDVARALASRPRVLLLDEPAAGLPHDEADELIDHVLELARPQGTTVVIIEHNVDLVRRVCDRLVVLAAGALLAEGDPADVLEAAPVVEAYLGA